MTIETKYNIGQEVWFTTFNKRPASAKINGIKITGSKNHLIEYQFLDYGARFENSLFPTKEELLKSL